MNDDKRIAIALNQDLVMAIANTSRETGNLLKNKSLTAPYNKIKPADGDAVAKTIKHYFPDFATFLYTN